MALSVDQTSSQAYARARLVVTKTARMLLLYQAWSHVKINIQGQTDVPSTVKSHHSPEISSCEHDDLDDRATILKVA